MFDPILQEVIAVLIHLIGWLGVIALGGVLIFIGVGFALDISERRAARHRTAAAQQAAELDQNAP